MAPSFLFAIQITLDPKNLALADLDKGEDLINILGTLVGALMPGFRFPAELVSDALEIVEANAGTMKDAHLPRFFGLRE